MMTEIYNFFGISALYVLGYIATKRRTVFLIKDVGINFRFYPKHYVLPCRLIRKHYHLKKEKIPKYLYFSLWLSFVCGVMIFMAPIIFLCAPIIVSAVLFFMFFAILFLDTIRILITSHFYKKR